MTTSRFAKPEARGNQQINYAYTREGSPLKLQMPPEPGTYEIRYILSQDRQILASRSIEVTPVSAQLKTPGTASAASEIVVEWQGPDYENDYISVAKIGSRGNQQNPLSVYAQGLAPEAADAARGG